MLKRPNKGYARMVINHTRFKVLIITSLSLLFFTVSGCGSGGGTDTPVGSPVGGSEVWITTGDIKTTTTLSKDGTGACSASGDWKISSNGYIISCQFNDGTVTLSKTTLSFVGTGETTAMGGDIVGVQKVKFIINASGAYSDGEMSSGSFKITFSNNDPQDSPNNADPPSITSAWLAKRQSGSNVTYTAPVGNYSGTFSGGDSGTWRLTIDKTGHADGTITSTNYKKTTPLYGAHELDNSIHLQDGLDSSTYYKGRLDPRSGSVSGSWKNPNPHIDTTGSFSGSRQ